MNKNNLSSDDWQEYIDQIFDRTNKLVNLNIWDPVSKQKLKGWMDCLALYDAKLLGAYLLDNFCCRSREQFLSMFDILLYGLNVDDSKLDLLDIIKYRPDGALLGSIKIAPVIGLHQPPTKSGPYVLRLIQRRFRIHSDWLTWPNNLGDLTKIRQLYFVDDFCGTGNQFIDFANSIKLDEIHQRYPNINITYLVSTIHEVGLKKIKDEKPYIAVKFSDCLNQSHQVFSDACFSRYQVVDFKETVLEQYQKVLRKANLPMTGSFKNGYGELGLAYCFSHSTPNNTLPIFWFETSNWTPLINR